jgi:hypothetical protein
MSYDLAYQGVVENGLEFFLMLSFSLIFFPDFYLLAVFGFKKYNKKIDYLVLPLLVILGVSLFVIILPEVMERYSYWLNIFIDILIIVGAVYVRVTWKK